MKRETGLKQTELAFFSKMPTFIFATSLKIGPEGNQEDFLYRGGFDPASEMEHSAAISDEKVQIICGALQLLGRQLKNLAFDGVPIHVEVAKTALKHCPALERISLDHHGVFILNFPAVHLLIEQQTSASLCASAVTILSKLLDASLTEVHAAVKFWKVLKRYKLIELVQSKMLAVCCSSSSTSLRGSSNDAPRHLGAFLSCLGQLCFVEVFVETNSMIFDDDEEEDEDEEDEESQRENPSLIQVLAPALDLVETIIENGDLMIVINASRDNIQALMNFFSPFIVRDLSNSSSLQIAFMREYGRNMIPKMIEQTSSPLSSQCMLTLSTPVRRLG